MKKLPLIIMLFVQLSVWAQVLHPAQWTQHLSKETLKSGDEVDIVFDVDIEDNWYLYSTDFDPDLGPLITEFKFIPHDSYELVGGIVAIDPIKKYDSLWEGEITIFKKHAQFIQKIIVKSENPIIKGSYFYQVCTDVDGKCISFDEEFEIGKHAVLVSKNAETTVDQESKDSSFGKGKSFWGIFILAFLAGLTALATPCVYPLIPITVSIFLKQSNSRKEGITKAIVYGLSIIVFFSVLGFLISLIWGFSALNELSTHWLFNLSIFSVFILFALSFFGLFEITLPSAFVNKIDRQADKGGYMGIFFMAATLVVVSFSCTVPIVGTALLTALNDGNIIAGTTAMFAFSLAFAIPFTAFAIFPSVLKEMPKSGGWLNNVKVVLGFLEIALALKFLSIADLAYHWHLLDREVFLALWIVIFTLLGFYLLGKLRLPKDSIVESVSVLRLFLSIIVFSFVMYLIPGMFGAPLKALSGFLPPQTTQDFNLHRRLESTQIESTICEAPKYADFLHFPHGIQGYFDYDQALACAKQMNKPLFIDFTGHGCVNCREMEARVWSDPGVLTRFKENFVMLALYVDDKTELPESEWKVSSYDQKLKKTIGKLNADFQISRFNNNAQPYYVILNTDGELLLPPKAYDLNIVTFVQFLDEAKRLFGSSLTK